MARVLQFHPYPGFYVPGYPNTHHDAERVAREAAALGISEEDYVAGALAYHWPDGKPAFTVGPHAEDEFQAVADEATEAPAPKARKT